MSEQKHTRGPWQVGRQRLQRTLWDAVFDEDGTLVAYVDGECEAKLIAAAPDLLEALCDMVSDHADLSEATLMFARNAITKATA